MSIVDELFEDSEFDKKIVKSFQTKNHLSPKIFKNDILMPDVREHLLKISDKFIDHLGVKFFIYDIVLTGSLANYNWSEFSDVDLHILVDLSENSQYKDIIKDFLDSKKNIWNSSHDIKIKGFEVELYVQDISEKHLSSGVYSVLNNHWLIKPEKGKHSIDENQILSKGEEYAKIIDDLSERSKGGENLTSEVDDIKDKIKRFRQCGLETGGEYSYENLTFKLLRRNGYIKKLLDIKKHSTDNFLSVA